MATIKFCTDLSQSKILSKILSDESADMKYENKYKEALNKAKELMTTSVAFDRFTIERIFPELKESLDERIMKSLKILLQHFCNGYRVPGLDFPVSYKDMLAWLEKQGEQKFAEWSKEDEDITLQIEQIMKCASFLNIVPEKLNKINKWLKSLKQRIIE